MIFRLAKKISLCFILVTTLIASSYADEILVVEITAEKLNVRDKPSTTASVTSQLQKGQTLFALPVTKGWAIVYLKGKKLGYASSKYMRVLRKHYFDENGEDKPKCNADTAALKISITDTNFECQRSIISKEIVSCSVYYNVALDTTCNEFMVADVNCSAEFIYETENGILPSQGGETITQRIYLDYGHGNSRLEVNWNPLLIGDKLTRVKLTDGSCSIQSVYDY
ncbi:SH3 domain-containing protein [Vibrio sp. HN007]|uniref:SH3 domain-containing protein n=1 Tax=Vibrio iocasae TaxID=3098914 RepID=UPI0035D43728